MFFCLFWHLFEKKDALDDGMKDKAGTGFQAIIPCRQYQVMCSKISSSSETVYWNTPGFYLETAQTVDKIFPNGIHLTWIKVIKCAQQFSQVISLR